MTATHATNTAMKKVGISRRGFLGGAALGSAAAALGLAGYAPTVRQSEGGAAGGNAADVSWDDEVDVLVVGSGYAGLAVAYEAAKAGARVRPGHRSGNRQAIRERAHRPQAIQRWHLRARPAGCVEHPRLVAGRAKPDPFPGSRRNDLRRLPCF